MVCPFFTPRSRKLAINLRPVSGSFPSECLPEPASAVRRHDSPLSLFPKKTMKTIILLAILSASVVPARAQSDSTSAYVQMADTIGVQELQEAVVRGHLPQTKMKGDAMVTRIAGTPLEKSGTVHDLLRRVPGMIQKGDGLEVIGRGAPAYYVNGRRVRDLDELKRLMSDEVSQVEVITNPGAIYDATVTAVVRIHTLRRKAAGLSLDLFGKTEQSLRTDGNDPEGMLSLNYRVRGLDIFASAKEWKYSTCQWSQLGQMTTLPADGTELYRYEGDMDNRWRGIGTHVNGGLNWQINDKHSLGAKVDYAVTTHSDTRERLTMEKSERGTKVEYIETDLKKWSDKPDNVQVNAYYNGNLGKLNIDFNADMFFSNDNERQTSTELTDTNTDRDVEAATSSSNHLIATKLILSYPIWKGNLSAGTEESFVSRDNSNSTLGTQLKDSQSAVQDNTVAAFVQYGCALSQRTQFSVGLRYEHASFDFTDHLDPTASRSRCYDNLFPSASVSTALGKVRLSLSYASRTQRPSFWQLNDNLNYHNRYVVQQGNPTLKPSVEHNVSLMAMYKILTVGANFSHINDLVCNWSEGIEGTDGMVRVSFKNLESPQRQLNVFATAGRTWGCYTPSATFAVVKQWLTLTFDTGRFSFGKPLWVFNMNNAFRLPHSWQFELNSEYHSKANYSNVELTCNYWMLTGAVQKSFLKNDALTLRLSWQDIFRKANESVFINYGSYSIYQTNRMDYNRLILTLRYNFNPVRSKYKGTGAGQDAISRIGSGKH